MMLRGRDKIKLAPIFRAPRRYVNHICTLLLLGSPVPPGGGLPAPTIGFLIADFGAEATPGLLIHTQEITDKMSGNLYCEDVHDTTSRQN